MIRLGRKLPATLIVAGCSAPSMMDAGYDAMLWPETPPDYGNQYYGKYVVFEPKNIRLLKAAFDPAKSDSADLMA